MITETYKGRKIRIIKGRGRDFGYSRVTLNGTDLGKWQGDESKAQSRIRGSIDAVDKIGNINGNKYGAEWYAPGTFEMCENGHPKEIGGECLHSYCLERRPVPAAKPKAVGDVMVPPAEAFEKAPTLEKTPAAEPVKETRTMDKVKIWYESGAYEEVTAEHERFAELAAIFAECQVNGRIAAAELYEGNGDSQGFRRVDPGTTTEAGQCCGVEETDTGNGYRCTLSGPHTQHQAHGLKDRVFYSWPVDRADLTAPAPCGRQADPKLIITEVPGMRPVVCARVQGHRGLHRETVAIHSDTYQWSNGACLPVDVTQIPLAAVVKGKCGRHGSGSVVRTNNLTEHPSCARTPGHGGLHRNTVTLSVDGIVTWGVNECLPVDIARTVD